MKHQIGTERKIKSSDTEREALDSNFSVFRIFYYAESLQYHICSGYSTVSSSEASAESSVEVPGTSP